MSKVASMFHPKRLDLSGFVNTRLIRDHNKRNAFAQMEPERYVLLKATGTEIAAHTKLALALQLKL
jgi:small subunit ribosomal protein S14